MERDGVARLHESPVRVLCLLLVVLFGTSCVPPACLGWAYDYSPPARVATLRTFTDPHREPPESSAPGSVRFQDWFHRGVAIDINARGSMAVQRNIGWPDRCPRLAREDLEAMSREWEPFLELLSAPHTYWRTMRDPEIFDTDWRPEGPVVDITFHSPASGKSVSLLWDGSRLPGALDPAVIGTLETMCSNSNWARKHLLRDLPPQVASRLRCRR
jgi:hypothetical protein